MAFSWQTFGVIMAILFVLGIVYNYIVAEWQRQGYTEGYTSLTVAIGVLITLIFVAALDWKASLLALAAFAASGTPMILGSIWRYVQKRKREQEEARLGETT